MKNESIFLIIARIVLYLAAIAAFGIGYSQSNGLFYGIGVACFVLGLILYCLSKRKDKAEQKDDNR